MDAYIYDSHTNSVIKSKIEPICAKDFDIIENEWPNNILRWSEVKESKDEIYKLVLHNNILGMIWFYRDTWRRVEIRKLEVQKDNIGKCKRYLFISGCLIAFACNYSINNATGDVILMESGPKPGHYMNNYGFRRYNNFYLISDKKNSIRLVNEYLNHSFI